MRRPCDVCKTVPGLGVCMCDCAWGGRMALPSCWDVTVETAERVWGCRAKRWGPDNANHLGVAVSLLPLTVS